MRVQLALLVSLLAMVVLSSCIQHPSHSIIGYVLCNYIPGLPPASPWLQGLDVPDSQDPRVSALGESRTGHVRTGKLYPV